MATSGRIITGRLRTLLTIQNRTSERGSFGGKTPVWTDATKAWAEVIQLRGQEVEVTRQVAANSTHRIKIRFINGLSEQNRFVNERTGQIFNIATIDNPEYRNHCLICDCTEDRSTSGDSLGVE